MTIINTRTLVMSANLATELSKNFCDGYRNIFCICSCIDFLDGLYKLIEETIFYMCVHWTYTMKIYGFTEQNKRHNGAFYSTVLMVDGIAFNDFCRPFDDRSFVKVPRCLYLERNWKLINVHIFTIHTSCF